MAKNYIGVRREKVMKFIHKDFLRFQALVAFKSLRLNSDLVMNR
jgi:hypothetical protein